MPWKPGTVEAELAQMHRQIRDAIDGCWAPSEVVFQSLIETYPAEWQEHLDELVREAAEKAAASQTSQVATGQTSPDAPE